MGIFSIVFVVICFLVLLKVLCLIFIFLVMLLKRFFNESGSGFFIVVIFGVGCLVFMFLDLKDFLGLCDLLVEVFFVVLNRIFLNGLLLLLFLWKVFWKRLFGLLKLKLYEKCVLLLLLLLLVVFEKKEVKFLGILLVLVLVNGFGFGLGLVFGGGVLFCKSILRLNWL